jgi:hypothetical protein
MRIELPHALANMPPTGIEQAVHLGGKLMFRRRARVVYTPSMALGELDRRSSLFSCRPVVAHIGPDSPSLGLAAAGCQYRHGRVVGMELASGEDMPARRPESAYG